MSGGRELAKVNPVKLPAGQTSAPARGASDTSRRWTARAPVVLGVLALLVLVGGFGTWATMTEISGAIIAQGQIEVERNRQVVQHPDGGVVTEILVEEGQEVAQGETLIRLDTVLLNAQLRTSRSQLYEVLARRARLEAERDGVDAVDYARLTEFAGDTAQTGELMAGQSSLFQARLDSDAQMRAQLAGRRSQIARQVEGIESQQGALTAQLDLIQEELGSQQDLLDRGLAQASRVLSLRREEARLQGQVGELIASAGEAAERMSEIDLQILALGTQRREDAITELRDLELREFELRETESALSEQLTRTTITAPVAGIVYGLTVFGERAVIRPAEPVLYLVPQDRPLVIAARISPINIDQVERGQDVTLRFTAFDARTTPELRGEVIQISADSFTDDASQVSFYRAQIELKPGEMERLPEGRVLVPGMPVEAFLRTNDRTPFAYLVKPLSDYFNKAFRES